MSATLRDFLKGAFGLIAFFLLLAHANGFKTAITAGGGATSGVFKTLQGR